MTSSLHIIGGLFKGRRLRSPKTTAVRPTSAIVRKALFDICRPLVKESVVLDLFAGSGAVGLEALSQGAKEVIFVEKDRQALKTLEENIASLPAGDYQSQLIKGEALAVLIRLEKEGKKFDLIYLDPPYDLAPKLLPEILHLIDGSCLLHPDGFVFVEEKAGATLSLEDLKLERLKLKSSRRFGMTCLSQLFFR